MNRPTGNCPVCKKPFAKGDDIVICPDCGAPYHRHCYSETGHCLFKDKHGNGYEYKDPSGTEAAKEAYSRPYTAPESVGRGVVCPHCQTVNDARNIFCEKCGHPLHAAAGGGPGPAGEGNFSPNFPPGAQGGFATFGGMPLVNLDGDLDGIPKRDWAAYIGSAAPTYISRMAAQTKRDSKLSFMFSAFFLGPFFFAYRKMWGWALGTGVVTILLMVPNVLQMMQKVSNPLVASFPPDTVSAIVVAAYYLSLVFQLLCGVFALYLYRRSAGKKIKALRQQHSFDGDYQAALRKKGGVSAAGIGICVGVMFALSFLLAQLIGPDIVNLLYPGTSFL